MRFVKSKFRVVALAAVIALLVGGAWLVFKPDHHPSSAAKPITVTSGTSSSGVPTTFIETSDFKYEMPAGWLQLNQSVLDQSGATSGIARISPLAATFKTSLDPSTPKDDSSVLNIFRKNAPNFALLSSSDTQVASQAGRQFIYSFTDTDGKNKVRQQLNVIPYKGRTFFLLFSTIDSDFDKQTGDFSAILSNFHFK